MIPGGIAPGVLGLRLEAQSTGGAACGGLLHGGVHHRGERGR